MQYLATQLTGGRIIHIRPKLIDSVVMRKPIILYPELCMRHYLLSSSSERGAGGGAAITVY